MSSFPFAARARSISAAILFVIFAGVTSAQKPRLEGRVNDEQAVEFDVFLPLQNTAELDRLLAAQQIDSSPNYHKWLTPQEFRARFGARSEDITKVSQALQTYGMTVTGTHARGVRVQARAGAIESAFGTALWTARASGIRQRLVTAGPLTLPATLKGTGAQIVHFSPSASHHVHSKAMDAIPNNRYGSFGPYWVTDLKQAYRFPSAEVLTGRGVNIAIVMSSDVLDSDMALYFGHEKLTPPTIVRRPVNGGAPFDPNSDGSFEATLDVQQSGGMAPGATIYLYNTPDLNDNSIITAYSQIVEENVADIVSSSFGGAEAFYLPAYNNGVDYTGILRTYEDIFKQGNAQGITFVASSGDNGALGSVPVAYLTAPPQNPPVVVGNFQAGIEYPAASPSVTAVGGTNPLQTTYFRGSLDSFYIGEQAYGNSLIPYDPYGTGNLLAGGYWGSGGGISTIFSKPAYQRLVNTRSNMRTTPDVSLFMGGCPGGITVPNGCNPNDGYVVEAFAGKLIGVIGTSVSAPGFAGLLALEEEHLRTRLGNVNYQIYIESSFQLRGSSLFNFFNQNMPGFNGLYNATPGYNYVIGNGTPVGTSFILAPDVPPAGTPQTPTNP